MMSGGIVFAAEEVSLLDVTADSNKSLLVTVDKEIDVTKLTSDDTTLLQDLEIVRSEKDNANPKRVMVELADNMQGQRMYRLMTIAGSDASINFETPRTIIEQEIMNQEENDIASVTIVDEKNLEVLYKNEIEDEIELKVFEDLKIEEMRSETPNSIMFQAVLTNTLVANSDYKFMLLGATGTDGEKLEVSSDTFLLDFTTGTTLDTFTALEQEEVEEVQEPETVEETQTQEPEEVQEEQQESAKENLNAAADTTKAWELEQEKEENNVEEVAAQAETVPETGATTFILVFMTLLATWVLAMNRRK